MLRFFIKFGLFIAVLCLIIFLLPQTAKRAVKDKIFAALSNVLPASVKETFENFSITPAEKREEFIAKLQQELETAKTIVQKTGVKNQEASVAASSGADKTKTDSASRQTLSANAGFGEEIIKKIETAEQLLKEIEKNNNEPGIFRKTITSAVSTIQNIISNTTSTQTQLSSPCVCE